jgi:hypothetical protein
MRTAYRVQGIIQLIVGIGALYGGSLAISDPSGISFGMPAEVLRNGPFTSFLIPGLFLFFVLGLGHLAAFAAARRRLRLHWLISGGAGCILMAWIVIQCYVLQAIHYLHVIFFIVGLIESIISTGGISNDKGYGKVLRQKRQA